MASDQISEFRSQTIRVKNRGSYVVVYQRPGLKPAVDCNFFDGDMSIEDLKNSSDAMQQALKLAREWSE